MTDALKNALKLFDDHMELIGGCTDGGCVIVRPKGMHTNGGCKCPRDRVKMQRAMFAALNLRNAVAAAGASSDDVRVLSQILFALTERQKGNVIRSEDEYIDEARALIEGASDGGQQNAKKMTESPAPKGLDGGHQEASSVASKED